MSVIKERPILFSGPMVRAILEGRKTVTRRPVKGLQIPKEDPAQGETRQRWSALGQRDARYGFNVFGETEESCAMELSEFGACPYGSRGEMLWVRESLGYDCEYGHYFAAGGKHGEMIYLSSLFDDDETPTGYSYDGLLPERSVPSIHLHRRYSRILLEITAVRVERLQDISEEQALAEGVKGEPCDHARQACVDIGCWGDKAKDSFGFLWESLNGKGSWNANPWVWVVEFKRIEQQGGQ